jgi:RHS repeat-associated protein
VYLDINGGTGGITALRATDGTLLWTYQRPGVSSEFSSPVSSGVIYVASADNSVYALRAADGVLLWDIQTDGNFLGAPVVVNGIVFVGATYGTFYALRATDGTLIWSDNLGGQLPVPTVVNGVVYETSADGSIYALDATSGTQLWSYQANFSQYSPARVANGAVYLGSNDTYVYALNAADGTLLWRYQTDTNSNSGPIANGIEYGFTATTIYALAATNGALLWTFQPSDYNPFSRLVARDGQLYAVRYDGSLYALDGLTGAVRWSYQAGVTIFDWPLVVDGVMYVGTASQDSSVLAFGEASGALLWHYQISSSVERSAQVANGVVYISDDIGDVYALAASPAQQLPAQGATGAERLGGVNPSELYCYQACVGDPVDSYSGNFTHTFADISVPGRGLPLAFIPTYNAGASGVTGPLGYGWTHSYSWALNVDGSSYVTIQQENGSTVTFAPASGSAYTTPARVLATLVKNGDGSYTFTRLQDQSHYTFNAGGKLISETDRNGFATTLSYNGSGRLTTVTDPAGRTLTFAYDGSGRITTVTDPGGRSVSFSYDGGGNLQTATDVNDGATHFTYDANHLLLTMTDPRGGVVTNVYDGSGRVTSQTDALGRRTTLSYTGPDSSGNSTTTITDPKGNVTVDQYYNGLLLAETRGSGTAQAATWNYTYDPVSLGFASIIDPNGNTSTETWDPSGNLLSKADPLGRATTYTYDAQNNLLSVTDPSGVTTTNTYDAHSNLLTTSTPLVGTGSSRTTNYTYGDSSHPGDVTSMTDPVGKVWSYTYDTYGNRLSSADPLGDTTTETYNILGQRTAETSPLGDTTSYAHNAFGDVTAVTDPLSHVTSYQYDADRNVTKVTDANGHVTTNIYDLDNELTKVTRANSTTLQYAYDADGNQTGQTDGLGHTTTYAYDPLNRLISLTDPLDRVTSYAYDPAGNRISQSAPGSLVTTSTYDAANELTHVSYSDGQTPAVSYSYDANGRRTGMIDGTGTTSYTYDSLSRLTGSTDGAGHALGYGYDLAGRLTTITYPGASQTVTRSYDSAGRMTSVSDWLGHTTTFAYDKAGELTFIAYPDHVVSVLGYDHAGQLIGQQYSYAPCLSPCKVAWKPLLGFNYAHDPTGQLVSTTPNGIATPSEVYGYTSINQLATVSPSGGSTVSYAYDAADQPLQLGLATLTADAAGEVTKLTQGATTANYSFNTRGNRTQAAVSGGATLTYSYDQTNRLTSIAGLASGTTSYRYNGDGLRMSKIVGAASPEGFAWDTAEGLPLLLVDGALSFVTGPGGLPLEQVNGGQAFYFLSDQLGSTRALADGAGAIVATYTYNAYGATTTTTGSASTPLRFAGQYLDTESGLYYLRARLYDPATAQFFTRDPLAPLTKQPYVYAGDDPLNATDPSGWFVGGICFSFAAGFFAGGQTQVCNVTNFQGGYANTKTVGGGLQTPQLGVGVSLLSDPGANDVEDEAGPSYYFGGGGAFHIVGGSVSGPLDTSCGWLHGQAKGPPSSGNLGVGIGLAPVDVSAGEANTWVQKLTWQEELQQWLRAFRPPR